MYIKSKYAKIALKHADSKRKAQGIIFEPQALAAYRAKLKELAKNNVIAEGRTLDFEIYAQIRGDIKNLMDSVVYGIADKSEEFRKNVSASDYVLAAHDYLLAMATIELGSPDIDNRDLILFFKDWTARIIYTKPISDVNVEEVYTSQRRVDAAELTANKIQPLMEQLSNNETRAESVGKIFAEYKALYRRQANHGVFWRLFHLTENSARNTLLKEMEQTIKSNIGPEVNIDIDIDTPDRIAKAVEAYDRTARIESVSKLYQFGSSILFGFNEYIINPDRLEDANAELEIEKILKANERDFNEANNIVAEHDDVIEIENIIDNNNEIDAHNEAEEPAEIEEEIQNQEEQALNEPNDNAQLGDEIWQAIGNKVGRDIKKDEVIDGILTTMLAAAADHNEIYADINKDGASENERNEFAHDTTYSIYSEAFNSLESCQMNTQDRIIAAQKLSDIIINKATFIGSMKQEYAKYAQNYAITDPYIVKEFLETMLNGMPEYSINAIIGNARKELGVNVRVDSNKEEIKEDKKSDREKIAVDLSEVKAEAPKADAPKVEAESVKERLVIEELSEKVSDVNISAKVKENDAPVASKSKE